MNSTDLKTIADIMLELKQRWPKGLSYADIPNVVSFLNFRLRQQVSDFDRESVVNYFKTKMEPLCEEKTRTLEG